MKVRNIFGFMLFVGLLFLVTGSGLAREQQPAGSSGAAGANASSAANAPWFISEVDTDYDTGQYPSVADDQAIGDIYVSYYNADFGDMRMAQYVRTGGDCGPNNSWVCQTVDSEGDVGMFSSMAISPGAGLTRITYYDATLGDLKIAKKNFPPHPDSLWTTVTIDKGISPTSTGLYASMELVPLKGQAYVSYHSSNPSGDDELKMAYQVSSGSGGNCGYGTEAGKWQCDTIQIGEGVEQHTSLALDGSGDTHIAYYDRGNGDLWYATNRTGSNCCPGNNWTCYPVTGVTTDVGKYASLYMDSGKHFHIAYYDATNDVLKYAVDVGSGGNCGVLGSAQCDEIDSMQADYHPLGISIAEDAAGYPVIAYQSYNGSLNLARPAAAVGLSGGGGNCGPVELFPTWYCETIDRHGTWVPYRNADFVSISVNSSGLATIAYNGFITSTGGNLNVATQRLQIFLPLTVKDG